MRTILIVVVVAAIVALQFMNGCGTSKDRRGSECEVVVVQITFASIGASHFEIYTANVDGTGRKQLTVTRLTIIIRRSALTDQRSRSSLSETATTRSIS